MTEKNTDDAIHPASAESPADDPLDHGMTECLRRMARKDPQALEEIYDATHRVVHALALRIVGDEAAAEEILSDVYLHAWTRAAEYDPSRGPVRTWLLVICRSRSLDAIRARKRHRVGCGEHSTSEAAFDEDNDLLAQTCEASRVFGRLKELSPVQRQCIALAFYRGLSHSEIAAHLRLPLGTIKSHVRNAINSLRVGLDLGSRP